MGRGFLLVPVYSAPLLMLVFNETMRPHFRKPSANIARRKHPGPRKSLRRNLAEDKGPHFVLSVPKIFRGQCQSGSTFAAAADNDASAIANRRPNPLRYAATALRGVLPERARRRHLVSVGDDYRDCRVVHALVPPNQPTSRSCLTSAPRGNKRRVLCEQGSEDDE